MIRLADHPLVPNGMPHKNRRETVLAASIIQKWHVALKFCRDRKGLSVHQLADRIGVSDAELIRWESGLGCPSGSQLPRLYASLPQLQAFKEYLPKLAVKTATMVEVAQARTSKPVIEAVAKPVPPPPPPKTLPPAAAPTPPPPKAEPPAAATPPAPVHRATSFGAALRMARYARGWDQREGSIKVGMSQSAMSAAENDAMAMFPSTYLKLVTAFPELKDPAVPPPQIRASRTRHFAGTPAVIEAARAPEPTPAEEPKALAPLPAGESLAVRYATALDAHALAVIEAETAQKRFIELDDAAKAAKAHAEDLLRQLHERTGWKG